MKIFVFILLFSLAASPITAPSAHADEKKGASAIQVNETEDAVSIVIDGKEVARFTSAGLLVSGNIEYGGTIKDGGATVRGQLNPPGAEAGDER